MDSERKIDDTEADESFIPDELDLDEEIITYDSDYYLSDTPENDDAQDNEIDDDLDDELDNNEKPEVVANNCTINRMTKYEVVHILSTRAQQLSIGCKHRLQNKDYKKIFPKTPLTIAKRELELGVLPMCIRRVTPNGTTELIK